MKDDRELLELAARAAGMKVWRGQSWAQADVLFTEPAKPDPDGKVTGVEWNPLADDGDALRLAVKLKLQVTPGTYHDHEATVFSAGNAEAHERVHYLQDIYAATRRAIVRAAAEIGKGMTDE